MNTEVCKALGKAIAEQRSLMNITQEDLASKTGLNPRSIQRIEAGREQPRYETLFKIALALDSEPQNFIHPMWANWLEIMQDGDC